MTTFQTTNGENRMRQNANPRGMKISVRFWIELVAGALSGLAVVSTSMWPQWIEDVFGADPDAGSGQAEWGISAGLCTFTAVMLVLAHREWRRAAVDISLD